MPIYMQYTKGDGSPIVGEAKDAAHKGWIELDSFSWDERGKSTRPDPHDAHATKAFDLASHKLMNESLVGRPGTAVIEFVDKNGNNYLRVTLESVLVSGFSISADSGDGARESLTLNFSKATHRYESPHAPDNTAKLQSILRQFKWFDTP